MEAEKKAKVSITKKKNAANDAASQIGVDKKHIRTIRILAFLIPVIAVLIGMLAGSFAPFGTKDVMTSGGMTKHLTYYYELYDRVHGGEGVFAALLPGSGYDFSTVFTYYLSDPLNLLILLFPRTAILGVINILYALKIGLAGLFMSIFLTRRKARIMARRKKMEELRTDSIAEIAEKKRLKKEKLLAAAAAKGKEAKKDFILGGSEEPKSVIGTLLSRLDLTNLGFSTAFSLSAYMLGQGLDVSHLSVVVLFPLILMALDELLEDGKWKLYAALMSVSVFCSLYMTIIVFVFSILYTAAYDHSDLNHAIRNLLYKLVADILAAGVGAVIILNSATGSFFTSELSMKFPEGAESTSFFDAFKALLTGNVPSVTYHYGYGIDIFCGILCVFLLVLYIGNPNISLRRKSGQSAILVFLFSGLYLVTTNYILNGFFHSPFNICVFGFLVVFQMVSMAYEALLNLEHSPVWQVTGAALIVAGITVASLFFCDYYSSMKPFLTAMEFLFVYFILVVMYRSNSMTRRLLLTILPLMLMGEMLYTYVDNLRAVGSKSQRYENTLDGQVYEMTRQIKAQLPNARVTYYDPETSMSTPVSNTLNGYNYIIAPKNAEQVDALLTPLIEGEVINVYKNPHAYAGFYLPQAIEKWDYSSNTPFDSLNRLSTDVVGTGDIFLHSNGKLDTALAYVYDDDMAEDFRKTSHGYFYTTDQPGDLYGYIFNIRHLGEFKSGELASTFIEAYDREQIDNYLQYEYAFFQKDNFQEFIKALDHGVVQAMSSSAYTATVEAPADGYWGVPYAKRAGWSSDTSEISDIRFMDGYMLIPVKEGTNTVSLQYKPVILYMGIAFSILFLLLFIFIQITDKVKISATNGRGITATSAFIRNNYVYILTFTITTLVFVIMSCYTSSIPFGDKPTLIGDGYVQMYNGYRGILNDVKSGDFSALNWNMGIAIDRYADFAGYFLSPWSLIKLYFLPDSLALFDLVFGRYLNFVLPGLYLILFLTHRRRGPRMKKNDWRLIPIATAYTLSSYGISYFVYGNFGFLTAAPLLLLAMERLVYDKKPFLYIFFLFGQMGDAYYAFILCEFLFLYFFTMKFDSIKDFFLKGVRFGLSSIAAAGLACYRLIPYYFRSMQSPYKANDVISPVTHESGSVLSSFSDTMSFHQAVVVDSNDYKANIYVGILLLFFIPLYLMNRKVPLSVRIRRLVLTAVLFLGFSNSVLNFLFHGLHYQTNVPNRFAAFYILLLFMMFAECLVSWKDYSGKNFAITISGAFVVCCTLWTIAFLSDKIHTVTDAPEEASLTFWATMIIACIYLGLALFQLHKKHREAFRKAMLGVCMVEVILSGMYTFRKAIGMHFYVSNQDTYIERLAERNPEMAEDFHATEYIDNPNYNTSEYTAINSISAFSSMMTDAHMEIFDKWGVVTSKNCIFYETGNPLIDMMMHVQYQLTNTSNGRPSPYPVVDHEGVLNLHKNPYYLPVGVYIPLNDEIKEWNENDYTHYSDSMLAYQNAFSHAMGCGDIFHEITPELDQDKIDKDSEAYTYILTDASDFLAGIKNEVENTVHVAKDVEGDVYASYFGTVVYLGTTKAGTADEFKLTMYLPSNGKNFYIRLAVTDTDELQKLHDKLAENVMTDARISGSSMTGTITAPEDGMLYLSIPNMQEWKFTVDGQSVESTTFLGGIGLNVTKGTHEIKLTFVPQGMWLGIGISAGVLILLILFAIFTVKRRRDKAEPATPAPPATAEA